MKKPAAAAAPAKPSFKATAPVMKNLTKPEGETAVSASEEEKPLPHTFIPRKPIKAPEASVEVKSINIPDFLKR